MSERVRYELRDGVGWVDIDDGKVNVMSLGMQTDLGEALRRAEGDGAVLVLRGRPGIFSAGFDLNVVRQASDEAGQMVLGGFELAYRLLAYPRPVLIVCTGHAIAMGTFLVRSGDYRLATSAPARLTANEVAIGLTLPRAAVEILRQRLTPAAFQRAALLSEVFDPPGAVGAGLLDEVVEPDALDGRVAEITAAMVALDRRAHEATKQRTRAPLLAALRQAIEADRADFAHWSTGTSSPTS